MLGLARESQIQWKPGSAVSVNGPYSQTPPRVTEDVPTLLSYDCNGTGAQKWVLSDYGPTKIRLWGTNYCLDAGSSEFEVASTSAAQTYPTMIDRPCEWHANEGETSSSKQRKYHANAFLFFHRSGNATTIFLNKNGGTPETEGLPLLGKDNVWISRMPTSQKGESRPGSVLIWTIAKSGRERMVSESWIFEQSRQLLLPSARGS
jgi:hypothetical protein